MKTLALSLGIIVAATIGYQKHAESCGFKAVSIPSGKTKVGFTPNRAARSAGPDDRSPVRAGIGISARARIGDASEEKSEPVNTPEPTPAPTPEPAPAPEPVADTTPDPAPEEPVEEPADEEPPKANLSKANMVKTLYFANNSDQLTVNDQNRIEKGIKWLKKYSSVTLTIQGHTNSVGDNAYNMDLGERRAQAVKDYLISQGIEGSRIEVESFGEDKPAFQPGTSGKNRRIVIVLHDD